MANSDFEDFCDQWVKFCIHIEGQNLSKYMKGRVKGKKFEEASYEILKHFVPPGYRIIAQKKIRNINYKFDFLFVKSETQDYEGINPSDVIAAFEVKSHGTYGYSAVEKLKSVLQSVKQLNPKISLFYVTFRETDTYAKKVNEIFGDLSEHFYRLSDSGDGVQLPPKQYFPEAWERLINNLKNIRA